VVLGDKWEVAIAVAVELDGPVRAKVKGTFVKNWGWMVLGDKWHVAMKVTVKLDEPVVIRFNSTLWGSQLVNLPE
jgi:hypothetical protein